MSPPPFPPPPFVTHRQVLGGADDHGHQAEAEPVRGERRPRRRAARRRCDRAPGARERRRRDGIHW